jgi:sugar lactone lactonase YvrE
MKKLFQLLVLLILCKNILAQELPPIFKDTEKKIVPAKTITSFPEKTFLENLILLPDGGMLVNSHYEGIVYKINSKGEKQPFASIKGKVTGIAAYGKDKFVLTGNDENDKAATYLLDSKGNINLLTAMPDAQFVNGITHLSGNDFLIADSYKGCVWQLNAKTKTVSIWLEDDLLKRGSDKNPTPAANGIKIYNNTVYISNTQQKELIKVTLNNGKPAKPELFVINVNLDDFIFDEKGNLYGATHVYNDVIKISPDKKITILAEQPQGTAGCTACVLKKNAKGYTLYVSTNGGMYYPPATGIEASKIVALQIQ